MRKSCDPTQQIPVSQFPLPGYIGLLLPTHYVIARRGGDTLAIFLHLTLANCQAEFKGEAVFEKKPCVSFLFSPLKAISF